MSVGIDGLQPADLKGGFHASRDDNRWSCYDPNRQDKEDYDRIMMPSDAMERAVAGNMITSVDGGELKAIYEMFHVAPPI